MNEGIQKSSSPSLIYIFISLLKANDFRLLVSKVTSVFQVSSVFVMRLFFVQLMCSTYSMKIFYKFSEPQWQFV